jgi:RND family efflux transporter MFP subunit
MSRKAIVLGVGVALALTCTAAVTTRSLWRAESASAPAAPRAIPVEVATAARKMLPVRVESLGTVTPIANVAIKARLESVITQVHFQDGAEVKQGDLLFTLDSRQLEAEIRRVEAVVAAALAQLQQAERDVARYTELMAKNATTVVTFNNAQTQVTMLRATADSNKAALDNLKVQLEFTRIRAPIAGRMSAAQASVGSFVRPGDSEPLATIVHMSFVYVAFTVPQRNLADLRRALTAKTATIDVIVPGESKPVSGQVTMIDHTVDAATGMATVRATMPNADNVLWPGMLVSVQLTLRNEEAIAVPSVAVNVSQTGTFVFVVNDGRAQMRPVRVARTVGDDSVIAEGLRAGETVVTGGQLLLTNGSQVTSRELKRGA